MPLKNLLYIGNKLSGANNNQTTIETLGNQFIDEGYNVVSASHFKFAPLRLADMLWHVVKHHKANFVLLDTYSTTGFWYAFAVSQLCRLLKMPYIPILHGGNLPNRLATHPKWCAMVFKNAFQNVAPSNYLLEAFNQKGYKNVTFIPNTIPIANYPFLLRKEIQPKLLWVRALATIYNPKMAICVLKELKKSYPNAQLCMIGPDKENLQDQLKFFAQELEVEVQFTGRMTKEEWITTAESFDVFINTTHFDNTPVSVMEALALGLPVVSTNVGGIPYLLQDKEDALLVNDNDVMAMVQAIRFLLENPDKAQEISKKGREKALHWDWNNVKLQWQSLLNQ